MAEGKGVEKWGSVTSVEKGELFPYIKDYQDNTICKRNNMH